MADTAVPTGARVESIDTARGLIMVLMALDHVRDYFGMPGISPTNLAAASPALFLTRWITHFCAPTFFLLMGTSAYLSLRKLGLSGLSRFLLTRGLWLVLLELVVMRAILQFNVDYHTTGLTVLWALGVSMVVLAGLVRLPVAVSGVFGAVLVLAHDAFDGIRSSSPLWSLLHRPGVLLDHDGHSVLVAYPLVPWIGVAALGFCMGRIYDWAPARRRRWLVVAGLLAIFAFVALRTWNGYGDLTPRIGFEAGLTRALSFLNTSKYPPSLQFLLMTTGPLLLLLALVDARTPRMLRPARVFGQVPLMYYLVHFLFIHLAAVALCYSWNGSAHWLFESPTLDRYPFTTPPGWGLPLPWIYAIWLALVVLMYPLCRRYARYRREHPSRLLSYL